MEKHLKIFKQKCKERNISDKLVDNYEIILLEYYNYKASILNVETNSWVSLSKSKNKLNQQTDCGTVYEEISKPIKLFPRLVDMSNEIREVIDYKKICQTKMISKQRLEVIDMKYFYKLLKIVFCYKNIFEFEDFIS